MDLGLHDLVTVSDGPKEPAERFYRDLEPALAVEQHTGQKQCVHNACARFTQRSRIGARMHQLSTRLVIQYSAIFVGNVNASALAKTRMAKSLNDAGWSMLRTVLQYKSNSAGVWYGP